MMNENNEIKIGDRVEVVSKHSEEICYSVGAQGIVDRVVGDDLLSVKFDSGEYEHGCEGIWLVDLNRIKKVSPPKIHNCECNEIQTEEEHSIKVAVECNFSGETLPKYGKEGDSALDLFALNFREVSKGELLPTQEFMGDGYILNPHERILVPTGFKLSIPQGMDATVRPRSGLTLKHGIVVQIGSIDNSYVGDVGMIVLNTSNEPYVIHKGDRLGQLRFSKPTIVELINGNLKESNRGETGFGDSGR